MLPGKEIRRYLDEALTAQDPKSALNVLVRDQEILDFFPEIREMIQLSDDPRASLHKNVWDHTTSVVGGVPNLLELRWAALFHDIGKSKTRRITRGGHVTFHGHDVVGARMVDSIQDRTGIFMGDDALVSTVRVLVLHHLRPASYKATWTDSAVRRVISDLGGIAGFERLLCLSRADLTTKNPARRARANARSAELEARVREIYAADNAPKLPKGTMGEVIKRVATKPGPWVNAVRDELEAAMAAGLLLAGKDVEFYVVEALKLVEENSGA